LALRVLQIIPTLVRGGAEKQLTSLATGLPSDQFDVQVCVLTHSGPYEQDLIDQGIPVEHIHKRWKADPLAYYRLLRTIRRLRPDIVHTWIFAANCYGRQAAIQAGTRVVIAGERCVDPWKRGYELAIDRFLAKRTTRIVTNSSGVVDFYNSQGIEAGKFTVIPNGIAAIDRVGTREELLAELRLPGNCRLIVAVGRLWAQKRYKDLIWAADLLKCVRDDVHLLIVGDGPEVDRLTRFRDQVEIRDRVHFLGERNDVRKILSQADCFWLGSGYEGQSNAMMEAMALGIPVVASDIPGNRDLVIPEPIGTNASTDLIHTAPNVATGYLVPVGDRAALARYTQIILDQPDLARRLGEAGRARMRADFTVSKMIDRHIALYQQLTS